MRRGTAGALGVAVAAFAALPVPASGSPAPAGTAALAPNTPSAGSHLLLDASGADGGFRPKQLPTALGIALAKGFQVDPAAVPGVCSADQADKLQCPDDSRLGAGAIGVTAYGPAFSPSGDHFTARLEFFRADPPSSGDLGGIVFSFKEESSGFSGATIGAIRGVDQGDYGLLIRWDKLPLPQLPPGFSFTVDHLQVNLGAGQAAAPVVVPHRKKTKHAKRKVRLRCVKYRGRKGHRHCVKYAHRKRRAHTSVAGSFLGNPPQCMGSWAVQLQVAYKDGEEQREAAAPCVAQSA